MSRPKDRITVTVELDRKDDTRLQKLAEARGQSKSELIRRLLAAALAEAKA